MEVMMYKKLILIIGLFLIPHQSFAGCKLSDLGLTVSIPNGYRLLNTECPKVAYAKNLTSNLSRGLYITKDWYPNLFIGKRNPFKESLDLHILATREGFHDKHKGKDYLVTEIENKKDYPPSLIKQGAVCKVLVTKTPLPPGVEWRRGVMCMMGTSKDAPKLTTINVFFFEMNHDDPNHKQLPDFVQSARKLFHSIKLTKPATERKKEKKKDTGLPSFH
jgi:hypothetical protein